MPSPNAKSVAPPVAVASGDLDEGPESDAEAVSCFSCGNVYAADAFYCRKCGEKRDITKALQDPDQIITFLCRKFSGLIDRVRVAEGRQAEAQQRASALAQRVRDGAERRQATSSQMQSALRTHLAEAEAAQQRLRDARAGADFIASELKRAREAAFAVSEQCEEIGSRCREEQRSTQDAAGLVVQEEEALAACERERRRLREETEAMSQRLAAQEEELSTGYERDRHRRADLRVLEARLHDSGRQRQAADKRSQAIKDELTNAQKQVVTYMERLATARATLQQGEEELRQEATVLEDVSAENLRCEQEEAITKDGLEKLRKLKAQLEATLRENVDAHSQLKAVKLASRSAREANAAVDARQKEAVGRLSSTAESMAAVTADLNRWQQRCQGLGDSIRQLRSTMQELEESSKGADNAGISLQGELQRVFAATEHLRAEREEAEEAAEELQRKLRGAEPALETARRRARELEENLEDMSTEVGRAKQRKETLLREVSQCREKMRGLRKRHSALSEKAQTLEKRLVRSSGSFGGTAGFAAAAGSLSAASSVASLASAPMPRARSAGLARASRNSRSAPQLPQPSAVVQSRPSSARQAATGAKASSNCPNCGSVFMADARFCRSCGQRREGAQALPAAAAVQEAEVESLGYLRQWVELEEARLGVARTPPRPIPAPSSLQPLESALAEEPAAVRARSSSPAHPRSAAALAALSAGADPREALALLDSEPQQLGASGSRVRGRPSKQRGDGSGSQGPVSGCGEGDA